MAPHSTTMGVQGKGHFIEKCGNVTLDAIVYTNNRSNKKNKRKEIVTEYNQTLNERNNGNRFSRQNHEQKKKLKRERCLKNHIHNKDSK
jgi:hypothetical protein